MTHGGIPGDNEAELIVVGGGLVGLTLAIACAEGGIRTIVECGPGAVLAGLVKRIERRRETKVFALEDPESFPTALAATMAAAAA